MQISFTEAELEFQAEVRKFLTQDYPQDILEKAANRQSLNPDDLVRSQKALFERGWAAPNWPVEYGGTGWSATEKFIFEEERCKVGVPRFIPFGVKMAAPIIYTYGTDEQKQRFLPDILASNVWWCQGYSEPGAGSDLACLKTRAVRDGDEYVINGGKTWTTWAQYADWMFCLVRTDGSGKPQEGITFLLIDMKSPGVTVEPIELIDGTPEVNSVFFDDVRVPIANRIGEEGQGWTYAKVLLTHERTGQAFVAQTRSFLTHLRTLAERKDLFRRALIDESGFSAQLLNAEIGLEALATMELRTLSDISSGGAPGPESSLLKVRGTELAQQVSQLWTEACGFYSLPLTADEAIGPAPMQHRMADYLNQRKVSIYGGSNEIQRNIISKAVLGL